MKKIYLVILVVVSVIISIILYFVYKGYISKDTQVTLGGTSTLLLNEEKEDQTPVPLFQYVEVIDGCGPYFEGVCVNVRGGPGENYPVTTRLRTGTVLKVDSTVTSNGNTWYKILFSNQLLYPERVKGDWYVSAKYVQLFTDNGDHNAIEGVKATSTKRIIVDVSEEKLYAYDEDVLFMEEPISTGLEFTPTPHGTFTIFKMTPSRFMQGPIPGVSDQVYDLPGVPWNLYFTADGDVIHGAYWHDHFGEPWSHGCVNLPPQKAKELYKWAEIGTRVIVQN